MTEYQEMVDSAWDKQGQAWEQVRWAEEQHLDKLEIRWLISEAIDYEISRLNLDDSRAREIYTGICSECGEPLDPQWSE